MVGNGSYEVSFLACCASEEHRTTGINTLCGGDKSVRLNVGSKDDSACEGMGTASVDTTNREDKSASVDVVNEDDSARIGTASEGDGSARVCAGRTKDRCADCEGTGFMQVWSF